MRKSVRQLHPDCRQYWETYAKYGLWNRRTVMAHCVWSDAAERQAIRNAGRTDIQHIIGVGGAKECFDMMKEDDAIFTAIATYLPTSGMYAVQYAREYLLNGGEIEKEIADEAFLITKDNVDEYYDLGY